MNKFNKLAVVNAIVLLAVIIYLVSGALQPQKQVVVYVDTIKLFNGFNMTTDMKRIEKAKIDAKIKALDGLYKTFNALSDKEKVLDANKALQQQIAYKSKGLQEMQDAFNQKLSKDVWERLQIYIKTYAESKNRTLILGKSNIGNIMYAKDIIDVTDEFLEYANTIYEGE